MGAVQFTDTHCHIQEAWKPVDGQDITARKWDKAGRPDVVDIIARAHTAGVDRLVCVGTTLPDSELAVEFVQARDGLWASIGLHPHEALTYDGRQDKLDAFAALAGKPKVVAIGECGLDFFYNHSPKAEQLRILRFQIELALERGLPMIFHVREAFNDFWPVFDEYPGIRGVMHSFSATAGDVEQIVKRGLYIGLNGIMTFTKDEAQLDAAKAVPLDHLLLETDAPFLTPKPFRGNICEPMHVRVTAEFLAGLRGEPLEDLAAATSRNAQRLFGF